MIIVQPERVEATHKNYVTEFGFERKSYKKKKTIGKKEN